MATIVNNPAREESTGNGVVIGILLVVFLAILFLLFGLPYLRNRGTAVPSGTNINVSLPTGGTSGGSTGGTNAQ